MPIGVFDSGLGGLTVLEEFRRKLPDQGFVYLGDNINAPYGIRDPGEVFDLTRAGCECLFDHGCRLVILACNTASAVALRALQETWVPADRRVLGVFVPMIEVIAGRKWADSSKPGVSDLKRVALFATPATVASHAFERELSLRVRNVEVFAQACPGLVDALESGNRREADRLVQKFVGKLSAHCPVPQAVVLGCTHYPLVAEVFRNELPQATKILSQPDIAADALADYLVRHPRFSGGQGVRYLTTGNPDDVSARAQQFLGRSVSFGPA